MTGAPDIAAAINAAEPVEFDQNPIELKEAGLSQRDALLQVSDKAEIWRSPDGETHASVPVGDHFEHHRLNSRSFRDWMLGEVARSYLNNGRLASVGETSMRDARLALEAQAYLNGVQQEAPLRTAAHGDAIYIDRGTTDWSAFEITSAGWKVEPCSPVPNLRSKRAAAFAEPTAPGSFAPLQRLLGHLDNDQFVLFVSWCLWALSPTGPYPILIVTGEAGSGKSTLVRLAQRLVDPVAGDLLQPPDNDRDLIAAARHGRALSFDNISRLRPELADSLCRLATGSEIGGRSLYTDHDTATFAACRPLILNGIPDLAARGDLADRSIVIRLTALQSRVTEREWKVEADRIGPATITALLDALVTGIARIEEVTTPNVRMADFASMIVAAEQSLPWKEGAFLRAMRITEGMWSTHS